MATNESNVRGGGGVLHGVFVIAALAVILGIGFASWPKIKAAYYAPTSAESPTQPTADTSAIDAIKAQLLRVEAQLAAARAQQPVIVQSVAPGESPADAPQVHMPPAAPVEGQPVESAPAAPAPIVIVSHEGYQQPVITGSGACAVAKGARRCGK